MPPIPPDSERISRRWFGGSLYVSVRAPSVVVEGFDLLFSAFPDSPFGGGAADAEDLTVRVFAESDRAWVVELDEIRAASFETADRVIPFLETTICQFLIHHRSDRIPIHASGVATPTGAVLMPGEKGSGKSTLSLWLAQRGYAYLGDEVLWIDPASGGVEAFPKAAAIKEGSFALFEDARPFYSPTRGPLRYYLPDSRAAPFETPLPIRRIVFPQFDRATARGIYSLCPEETLLYLSRMLFGGLARRPERFPALVALAQIPSVLAVYRDAREIEDWLRTDGRT